ncbi:hypothetical protein [Actinomycetospora termitidis]|uniref:Uncharacterized protein n=1 Tax=Actinomycetospora termitidis TaxID=3053470 RepID=A0ABT7M521_9PSEU|nr:hypothetical protein [Actinomycetospora sp. Odt1-22]MDL5155775.1 hypothetical protein [Actinomycetospora sp. Odt1-22]
MNAIDDGPTVRVAPDPDERHRRHRLGIVLTAGIGAVVLMAVVATVVALTGSGRPPQDPIGDPRTADPCAPLAASTFGAAATIFGDFRLPQQCAAVIGPVAGTIEESGAIVTAQLAEVSSHAARPLRTLGDLVVVRGTDDAACERLVVLPDGRAVDLAATGPQPCALVEPAVDGALAALQAGLPRRAPEPPEALTHRSACALVDPRVLGLDPRAAVHGWADWGCRWGDPRGVAVQAAIYRTGGLGPATEPDGRTVVVPNSDNGLANGCTAAIPHRAYRAPSGGMVTESLQITVSSPDDPAGACDAARRLAAGAGR